MDFTFVRIDNRLVHGQILEGWVPFVKASRIVVVNDEVAGDLFRETVIRMAVPHDIEVLVYSLDEFSKDYTYGENDGKNTIILFHDIRDSLEVYKSGFRFNKLNIGNVHCDEGRVSCSSSIFLSKNDIADLTYLSDAGVIVELRSVPRDKTLDFGDVVNKIKF